MNTRGAIQRQKEQNKRNYITMLLFMTTAYLFCVFMFFATTAIRRNTVEVEKKMMLLTFGELWLIMNNSTNFLFYFMSGHAFRKAFRKAIHINKSGKADENVELSSRTRETTQKWPSDLEQKWENKALYLVWLAYRYPLFIKSDPPRFFLVDANHCQEKNRERVCS